MVDPIAEVLQSNYRRIAASASGILDDSALLQSLNARMIADLVMCDPTYVLTNDVRERLLVTPLDPMSPSSTNDIETSAHHPSEDKS